ncbi:hypothetical protein ACHAXT_008069 [Thalassiosira profunda]
MDHNLRQRGWSVHSSDDHASHPSSADHRPRADSHLTCDTEPSLSEAEKLHLLDSAFEGVGGSADHEEHAPAADKDQLDMFGGEDESDEGEAREDVEFGDPIAGNDLEPPKKRRKTGEVMPVDDSCDAGSSSSDGESDVGDGEGEKAKTKKRPHIALTQKQQQQLDFAKGKLSKWAARLFDPNRPRGLFLTAFGKREKEYDELAGREIAIDETPLDSDTDGKGKADKKQTANCKVKIANLSYATTAATIARVCGEVGPLVDVNLILDDMGKSTGRAYVVFEDEESAQQFVSRRHEKPLEGRTLYISIADGKGRKSLDPSKESRYWERDISTKCNNCGEIGHIAKKCPNAERLKRCGLCAMPGHEMWGCPQKAVCFNCGVPGHVSRDCNQRRGIPERCVCTICYRSGHHRFECRERPWVHPDAVCMQCGQKGHLMCSELRWFFGLKGETCFNCGSKDHRGINCRRPDVDACARNPEVGQHEINSVAARSLNDGLSRQRSSRESRDDRPRQNSRSMPPPRNRNDDFSRRGPDSRQRRY